MAKQPNNGQSSRPANPKDGALIADASASSGPVITVDYDLYADLLDAPDITDEQRAEVLQTLWNIICEFVALGVQVHPVQKQASGQKMSGKNPNESTPSGQNHVYSLNRYIIENHRDFAEASPEEKGMDT